MKNTKKHQPGNIEEIVVVGARDNNLKNINVKIPRVNNRSFIMKVPEIAISRGSACTSSLEKRSHVLKAIGLSKDEIDSSLRFGVGRFNNKHEINKVSEIIESRFGG